MKKMSIKLSVLEDTNKALESERQLLIKAYVASENDPGNCEAIED